MKRSKTILISAAVVGMLFFALLVVLAGSEVESANALPPIPIKHPAGSIPKDGSLFIKLQESQTTVVPNAVQGLDFEFHKWVVPWTKDQAEQDCQNGKYNHLLVVNYNDPVRYCYEIINIGTTTIYTHTLWDDQLGSMENFSGIRAPGSNLIIYTYDIPISEETKNVASWTAIDEYGNQLTKYDSNLVKVAIRFRGYTFNALPSDPAPKPKLAGVVLELYGWDEGDLITESLRMTTTSDADGWWNFYMPETYDHYQIRTIPPEGYTNIDAWAPHGQKMAPDILQWNEPDRSIVQEAQFYFAIPTPTPTPSPTPTITPTPTDTPTPPPGMEPGIWLPLMVSQ